MKTAKYQVEVEHTKLRETHEFPKLLIDKSSGFIVLFKTNCEGTIVAHLSNGSNRFFGTCFDNWDIDTFETFNGSIIIGNSYSGDSE